MDILTVENLCIGTATGNGTGQLVKNISFSLKPGQILGLAGESGSGKTLTGSALSGLLSEPLRITSGIIHINGTKILPEAHHLWRRQRGREIFMIFQSSASVLNPVLTIGLQIREVLEEVNGLTRSDAKDKTARLLKKVGIKPVHIDAYPFQLSGGMRQRVQIAIALALKAKVIVADEPTTALDAITQMEILRLLRGLRDKDNIAILFISHDLSVVSYLANQVGIMHQGRLIEMGKTEEIFRNPEHPKTRELIENLAML